jgi:hypothetical protein
VFSIVRAAPYQKLTSSSAWRRPWETVWRRGLKPGGYRLKNANGRGSYAQTVFDIGNRN